MNIRRANSADLDAALEVWRAAGAAQGVRPSAARTARMHDKLAAPDALLVVAEQGGAVRGYALGEWGRAQDGAGALEPGLLLLAALSVHPAVQRTGVGSALAEALADAAYVKGARRLQAWADTGAVAAFLVALGLEPTGRSKESAGAQYEGELEPPLRELAVASGGLRLGQLLKLAGLVDTGAEAKALLEAGGVEVDGEVEHRRGRQLQDGEVVVAREQAVRVVLPPPG
ncbi:MAG TPA: GNAT family N-acetyltransferase [Mycobacteriales bacterium]|nr:GNAT family N-acetyltransferase [Mycobacteriales bacterium]